MLLETGVLHGADSAVVRVLGALCGGGLVVGGAARGAAVSARLARAWVRIERAAGAPGRWCVVEFDRVTGRWSTGAALSRSEAVRVLRAGRARVSCWKGARGESGTWGA